MELNKEKLTYIIDKLSDGLYEKEDIKYTYFDEYTCAKHRNNTK